MKTTYTPTPTKHIQSFCKVFVFVCLLTITQNATATIRYVTDYGMGDGSSWNNASSDLKAMIDASVPGDEVWVAAGAYQPASGQPYVMKPGVKIYGGFAGTETSLAQRDPFVHPSYLVSYNGQSLILNNNNALTGTALLDGFVIRDATQTAVINRNSSPAFANCTFSDNNSSAANNPGAMYNYRASPTLTNCEFIDNSASYDGGAMYNENASPSLINCTFAGNSASFFGSAVYNNNRSNGVFTKCSFINNQGGVYGGGMANVSGSNVKLIDCEFRGNYAGQGAGVYNNGSSSTLNNCLISGNRASTGGGIYNRGASPFLTNCTISGNLSGNTESSGAMYNTFSSNPIIRNTLIYNNSSGIYNTNGGTATISYSLVQGLTATTDGNISGTTDPLFVNQLPPAQNSGGDYRLQTCSPVVNKGSNSYYATGQTPDLNAITTDLDENGRFYNNGIVDMGAYERQGEPAIVVSGNIVFVKAGATGSGESWTCATGDLQAAINAANSGNQIWVAGGTYIPNRRADATGTINTGDRNNAFVLKPDVKIYGGFAGTESSLTDRNLSLIANASILSGDLAGNDNGFNNNSENTYHVVVSAGNMGTALLDGFTIQGGNCDNGGGGGIACSNSSPAFNNLIVKGNAGRYGAGLNLSSSSPNITNSFITGNTGFYGGGILGSNCGATFTNVLISGNSAVEQGGGMYNEWGVAPTLTNVTITGNTANYSSGAMYNNLSVPMQIRNSIIYGNNSGINNNSGTPVIQYSLVQGETSTTNGNIAGTVDPVFVNQAAAGLNTGGDYRLQVCSKAINAGSSSFYNTGQSPTLSTVTTDLNKTSRIQGNAVDMGVYEYAGNPAGADLLAINGDVATETISGSTNFIATNTSCRLITTLQPGSATPPISGSITTSVWIESTQPWDYVRRHYEVAATYTDTVKGRITLYFTQEDFDFFNAVNYFKLPTGPNDALGKGNLAIDYRRGSSNNGTGQPNTYLTGQTITNPLDNAIVWNAALSRWEVSFDFTGFNGFFVTSQDGSVLPLTLLDFSGSQHNGHNKLQWKTADEENTRHFILERGTDGSMYTPVATIPAIGNGNNTYNYKDYIAFSGKMYYRLKMVDKDEKYTYSPTVTLTNNGANAVSIYPNPATDKVYVSTGNDLLQHHARLYDSNGRLLQTMLITNNLQIIPVQQLKNGMYLLQFDNGTTVKFVKK